MKGNVRAGSVISVLLLMATVIIFCLVNFGNYRVLLSAPPETILGWFPNAGRMLLTFRALVNPALILTFVICSFVFARLNRKEDTGLPASNNILKWPRLLFVAVVFFQVQFLFSHFNDWYHRVDKRTPYDLEKEAVDEAQKLKPVNVILSNRNLASNYEIYSGFKAIRFIDYGLMPPDSIKTGCLLLIEKRRLTSTYFDEDSAKIPDFVSHPERYGFVLKWENKAQAVFRKE